MSKNKKKRSPQKGPARPPKKRNSPYDEEYDGLGTDKPWIRPMFIILIVAVTIGLVLSMAPVGLQSLL